MTTDRQNRAQPTDFDALVALAHAEQQAGRFANAAAVYQQILVLRPDLAEAHNNLGTLLIQQDKLQQAAECFAQALALKPDYAEAHNNLGNFLREQGQPQEAAAHFERALALRPNYAEAHKNLGNVLRDQGRLDQALARYRQALVHRPNYAEAHNNLGALLNDLGKFDQAVAHLERALALKPNYPEAHYNLGNALRDRGQLDQAAAQYEQALAARSNYPDALNNLGNVLKDQGQLDRAAARYQQALALKPDFAEAHYNRADLKTFQTGDADLVALESLAADAAHLPAEKRLYVHFALAKALDDVGDDARAFEQMLKGNALKRQEVDYDEVDCQRTFRLIAEVFDSQIFHRFAEVGDPSPAPIFILGMPRSGSTLVEQILASHPQVQGGGELKHLNLLVDRIPGPGGRSSSYPSYIPTLGAQGLRQLGGEYLSGLPPLPAGKVWITDKAPGNFCYVGLIRLILPRARIIHTVRDPLATCVSCFSKLFASGQTFSYDLAELGRYYRRYSELMAHWRSVLPVGALLEVSYEDVVNDIERQARRLIEYCGLPWDDGCLDFHRNSRPIHTGSNVQVRRPLYRNSLERWQRYKTHLRPLLAELDFCHPARVTSEEEIG